jgi:O-antigen/teichoic acid export membrane protein
MSLNTKENLLAKISKLVGLDLAKHIANGKWIILKFAVVAIGGWVLSLVFARLGTKETLGQYQYIISLITVVSLVSLPGLNTAAFEAVAKGREAGVIKVVRWSLFLGLFGFPILVGLGVYNIVLRDNLLIGEALILAGFLVPFYYAFNTWNIYYDGKSLFKEGSLRNIVLYICLYIFLISGLLLKFNVVGLVLTYLLVHILLFCFYFIEILKKIKDRTNDYVDFKFGVNSSIQRFVFSLSNNVPPLAISVLFGVQAVAIYYIGYYIINACSSLMGMLGYLYIPALFRGEKLNHKNIILQNLAIGVVFWIAFLILIEYFFLFMYGPGYVESQKLAFSLSFLMFLVPLKIFLTNFFLTGKKNWTIITIVSIANVLSLASLYFAKDHGFSISVVVYIYALELMTIIPLLFIYVKENMIRSLVIKPSMQKSL